MCMTLFTLRAHVRTLTNPHGEALFVAATKGKLDARLLYHGSLAFLTAAAVVVVLENQQELEVLIIEMVYHNCFNIYTACTAVLLVCSNTCHHGEPRTGIEVYGQK